MFLSSFKQVVVLWKIQMTRNHTGSSVSQKLQNGLVLITFILILNKSLMSLHFIACQVAFPWKKFHDQNLQLPSQVHPGTQEQCPVQKAVQLVLKRIWSGTPKRPKEGQPLPSVCSPVPVHPVPSHYSLYSDCRRQINGKGAVLSTSQWW